MLRNWVRKAIGAMVVLTTIAAFSPAMAGPAILLYGDSLLAGYGLAQDEGLAAQLQAAMDEAGIEATLVNASVSGDTTADGLARLDWTMAERPDALILGLGANDMLRGLSPQDLREHLDAMLNRFDELQLPVLLLGMTANRGLGPEYVAAFDAAYQEVAAEHGAILYPFYLDGVALDPALTQPDELHPNAAGVRVIVKRLLPYVEQLVHRLP